MPDLEITRSIERAILHLCRQQLKAKNAIEAVLRRTGATRQQLEDVLVRLRSAGISSDAMLGTIVGTEAALAQIEVGLSQHLPGRLPPARR